MSDPVVTDDVKRLTDFRYVGQRELRRCFTDFFRRLFSELEITKNYRWNEDDKVSKIAIDSSYPDDYHKYPRIIVDVAPMRVTCMSFGDLSECADSVWFSGSHDYDVTLRVRGLSPDQVENILDIILVLLSCNEVRDNFAQNYKCFIDISKGLSGSFSDFVLPGTSKLAFEGVIRLAVKSQWEIELVPEDVERILSEKVVVNR